MLQKKRNFVNFFSRFFFASFVKLEINFTPNRNLNEIYETKIVLNYKFIPMIIHFPNEKWVRKIGIRILCLFYLWVCVWKKMTTKYFSCGLQSECLLNFNLRFSHIWLWGNKLYICWNYWTDFCWLKEILFIWSAIAWKEAQQKFSFLLRKPKKK
jgi:hypothetical protein